MTATGKGVPLYNRRIHDKNRKRIRLHTIGRSLVPAPVVSIFVVSTMQSNYEVQGTLLVVPVQDVTKMPVGRSPV